MVNFPLYYFNFLDVKISFCNVIELFQALMVPSYQHSPCVGIFAVDCYYSPVILYFGNLSRINKVSHKLQNVAAEFNNLYSFFQRAFQLFYIGPALSDGFAHFILFGYEYKTVTGNAVFHAGAGHRFEKSYQLYQLRIVLNPAHLLAPLTIANTDIEKGFLLIISNSSLGKSSLCISVPV